MDEYCRFFGCQEKPIVVIDSWHYCNKHAKIARSGLAHQHNRSKAIDNITEGLTIEELQSLSPERVRASNELYEALKEAIEYFKRLSDEGHYPEFMLSENGGHGYSKLKDALAKADGGK